MKPSLHLFVCANRREGSPLGPGCGDRGEAVYDALKSAVTERRATARTWITKTHCLGICPKQGATVARYGDRAAMIEDPILTEVRPEDVPALLAERSDSGEEEPIAASLARAIEELEGLQRKKVLDLARRLRPGLTLEDVQNPHDFPELADPDWHYADGVLAGIASVKSAIEALRRERT